MKILRQFLGLLALVGLAVAPMKSGAASWVTARWPGLNSTDAQGWRPPDPNGAAGPQGVIVTVNAYIAYHTKVYSSTYLWGPTLLTDFFAPAGNAGSGNADPKVMFDRISQRFFVVAQENANPSTSFVNVAVSRNANPQGPTTNDWYFHRLEMKQTLLDRDFWGDYPCVGLDERAFYVTFNMFPFPKDSGNNPVDWARAADHGRVFVFNKENLINGTLIYRAFDVPTGFTLQPVSIVSAATPGNTAYFSQIDSPITARIWRLDDPLGSGAPVPYEIPIPLTGAPLVGAPQSGTTVRLDPVTPRKAQGNAFWYDGSLWFCCTGANPAGRARVWYYEFRTHEFGERLPAPLLKRSGVIGDDDIPEAWTMQPAIGANSRGDICIVYSQTSGLGWPAIYFTTLPHYATPLDLFERPQMLIGSSGYYDGVQDPGRLGARWGDYATVAVDPTDDSFWICHEYSRGSDTKDNWGTYWGRVVVPQHVIYVDHGNGCLRPEDLAYPFSEIAKYVPGWSWGTREGLGVTLDPRNPPPGAPSLPCPPAPLPCTLNACLGGPFKNVTDALAAASTGDALQIKAGNYNERPRINKRVYLTAKGGSVFIGKP